MAGAKFLGVEIVALLLDSNWPWYEFLLSIAHPLFITNQINHYLLLAFELSHPLCCKSLDAHLRFFDHISRLLFTNFNLNRLEWWKFESRKVENFPRATRYVVDPEVGFGFCVSFIGNLSQLIIQLNLPPHLLIRSLNLLP